MWWLLSYDNMVDFADTVYEQMGGGLDAQKNKQK